MSIFTGLHVWWPDHNFTCAFRNPKPNSLNRKRFLTQWLCIQCFRKEIFKKKLFKEHANRINTNRTNNTFFPKSYFIIQTISLQKNPYFEIGTRVTVNLKLSVEWKFFWDSVSYIQLPNIIFFFSMTQLIS